MFRILTIDADFKAAASEDPQLVRPVTDGGLRWVDLCHQDEATLALLGERFSLHPLTIEDCLHFDQRPKLETYDGYLFLVMQGFQIDWERIADAEALELHIFIGDGFLVTVHEHPFPALDTVWNRMTGDPRQAGNRSDQLCYLVADMVVDSYFPLLDELELRLDDLEDRVLEHKQAVGLGEILDFKRLLINLRKILSPQRDVLALLAKHGDGIVSERVSIYFRDVYDHVLRLHESVESVRELVGNIRDAHLWNASQRTNEIMKRLTILSAIFLPLTFITGFFGQNFEGLPFDSHSLMLLMLGSCITVPTVMMAYFVRSKWF
jgi:magnesium transporter